MKTFNLFRLFKLRLALAVTLQLLVIITVSYWHYRSLQATVTATRMPELVSIDSPILHPGLFLFSKDTELSVGQSGQIYLNFDNAGLHFDEMKFSVHYSKQIKATRLLPTAACQVVDSKLGTDTLTLNCHISTPQVKKQVTTLAILEYIPQTTGMALFSANPEENGVHLTHDALIRIKP